MTGFYVSIMFIGILLILISMVWIAYDKKKFLEDEKRFDEKKEVLSKIIADAELMIDELNRISDYIVSEVDKKSKEVQKAFESIDEKAKSISQDNDALIKDNGFDTGRLPNGGGFVINAEPSLVKSHRMIDEKIIAVNSKHKEVIALAQRGFNETEIAKKLSMGKGEIQLILGVNK
ncbi:MAG TPA: hypothetical protein PLR73_11360 [Acetivibrio sp.]|nr:hypothetical protein [Clostridium sp.]HOQ38286.1 hypothetical protein [Acetivibrio sp.]